MHDIKIAGLNISQIVFLAQYYESMTGKDPRKINFGCNKEEEIYQDMSIFRGEVKIDPKKRIKVETE